MDTPPRPPVRAVAFDLDGTMFDTEALFVRVAGQMMAARGKAFTAEMMAAMIGRQADVAYPALIRLAGLTGVTPDELLADARGRFYAEIDTAVHPTPGLYALLSRLEHRGLPRAVCTSSRRAYVERLLTNHGLMGHFAFFLGAEDVVRSKPDPEIYLRAAARFGVEPAALLVLEDSPAGVAAAKTAGAYTVGIPHDHSPPEGLGDAHLLVTRLDDPAVLALVDGP